MWGNADPPTRGAQSHARYMFHRAAADSCQVAIIVADSDEVNLAVASLKNPRSALRFILREYISSQQHHHAKIRASLANLHTWVIAD